MQQIEGKNNGRFRACLSRRAPTPRPYECRTCKTQIERGIYYPIIMFKAVRYPPSLKRHVWERIEKSSWCWSPRPLRIGAFSLELQGVPRHKGGRIILPHCGGLQEAQSVYWKTCMAYWIIPTIAKTSKPEGKIFCNNDPHQWVSPDPTGQRKSKPLMHLNTYGPLQISSPGAGSLLCVRYI